MLIIAKQMEVCTAAEKKCEAFQKNIEKQMLEAKQVLAEIKQEIAQYQECIEQILQFKVKRFAHKGKKKYNAAGVMKSEVLDDLETQEV
jgi:hypothetical protein